MTTSNDNQNIYEIQSGNTVQSVQPAWSSSWNIPKKSAVSQQVLDSRALGY